MRKPLKFPLIFLSAALALSACHPGAKQPVYKDAGAPVEKRVKDLVSKMTLDEKILQLNQYTLGQNTVENNIGEAVRNVPAEIGSVIYFSDDAVLRNALQKKAIEESRLGIPVLFGHDVIHGFRTMFPIPLAQACSWNPELVRRGSAVAAQEAYACGVDWTFSPMVDVARDPRWGRVMEGYGEDVYAASRFCEAVVKGYQGEDLSAENTIAACLKHFAGYGASEAGRDYVPTEISDQSLWDTYLPPFEAGVKAGAATLMSAFHNISGIPASGNSYLLTDILKKRWEHDGFVVSDWDAVRQLVNQGMAENDKDAALIAFKSGIEMDMVDDLYTQYLPELLEEKKISEKDIDEAVSRILRVKFRLGLFEKPYTEVLPESEIYLRPESLEAAEAMAVESMVLLKNENNLLPLKKDMKIALIGPLADSPLDQNGNWAARGRAEDAVTYLDGIIGEFAKVKYVKGSDFEGDDRSEFKTAVRAARSADVAVLCIGHKGGWSGENQSRSTIEVPEIQEELLAAVKSTGTPVVVLLCSGRPLDVSRIEPLADAMIQTWHPGTRGGNAVAGILSGRYNPSGKLAMTFPYNTGQIPIYYNHRNSGRRGDQGLYKDIQSTPKYDFGYGLSYSDFKYGKLTIDKTTFGRKDRLTASVTVTNTSKVDGMETVHWFICDPYSHITRPVKELKYFEKQLIKAGETKTFIFEIDPMRDFGFVNSKGDRYLDAGEYRVIVGDQSVTVNLS